MYPRPAEAAQDTKRSLMSPTTPFSARRFDPANSREMSRIAHHSCCPGCDAGYVAYEPLCHSARNENWIHESARRVVDECLSPEEGDHYRGPDHLVMLQRLSVMALWPRFMALMKSLESFTCLLLAS